MQICVHLIKPFKICYLFFYQYNNQIGLGILARHNAFLVTT